MGMSLHRSADADGGIYFFLNLTTVPEIPSERVSATFFLRLQHGLNKAFYCVTIRHLERVQRFNFDKYLGSGGKSIFLLMLCSLKNFP